MGKDAPRVCTECGKELPPGNAGRKTCGPTCRSARRRRLHRLKDRGVDVLTEDEITKDIAAPVLQDELRPLIRERITTEVLDGIAALAKLTPRAVELLADDLEDTDPVVRQKAYTLVMRYTLGAKSLAEQDSGKNLNVNFAMPRPGDDPDPTGSDGDAVPVEGDAVEVRTCERCHEDKPVAAFEGAAVRCRTCQEALRQSAISTFGA